MMHPVTLDWVLSEVRLERIKQDKRWGEQNHPDGTGSPTDEASLVFARAICKNDRWADILREEVYEALVETDPDKLSDELIQVAAVAVAWREAILRRQAK